MIQVERNGQWRRVRAIMKGLVVDSLAAASGAATQLASKAEQIAVDHLSNQDLGWEPLSPQTLDAKARRGESELTLIATSSMMQSITSWTDKDGAYVGLTREAKNDDDQPLADIARVQEYGSISRGIPARPLWGPTLEEAREYAEANNLFAEHMEMALKKYGV